VNSADKPWNWIDLVRDGRHPEDDEPSYSEAESDEAAGRRRGRPPLIQETYPVTVMLTSRQIEALDHWVVRFNTAVRGGGGHRVKRNHVVGAFIDALMEAEYDPGSQSSLDTLRADFVRRLNRGGETSAEAGTTRPM
jgi:hypothetical protein